MENLLIEAKINKEAAKELKEDLDDNPQFVPVYMFIAGKYHQVELTLHHVRIALDNNGMRYLYKTDTGDFAVMNLRGEECE